MTNRQIALNAAGGALVVVTLSSFCRRFDVIEDEGGNGPQGLIYQSFEDKFVATNQVGPATEPLIFENDVATTGAGLGNLLGGPAQNSVGAFNNVPATTVFKATSASAATTTIRFREVD
jgi:hypothetical protein